LSKPSIDELRFLQKHRECRGRMVVNQIGQPMNAKANAKVTHKVKLKMRRKT
jgi:hypothetical protein